MMTRATPHIHLRLAENALVACIDGMLSRSVETIRLARGLVLTERESQEVETAILDSQKNDGGWNNVEESAWSIKYLMNGKMLASEPIEKGINWVLNQRCQSGGWGLFNRDNARIPTTALVISLLNGLAHGSDYQWIECAWGIDIRQEIKLTYKGAFYLLAAAHATSDFRASSLVEETYAYLYGEQNNDGGFGPWNDHPVGSDPWSTGICLVGICSFPQFIEVKSVRRAIKWLGKTQLASGLWPYHFIDEGSAYAYWGLKEAIQALDSA